MTNERPYVIVLAGGDGNRLASLTRALYGRDLPKQFAVLAGEKSLMQTTVERALTLTSLDRISVVVTSHHESIAQQQLAPYPGVELVVQPKNLDTAAGMLLPLARLLARSASTSVIFLPSDHYISDPHPIADALRETTGRILRDRLSLIGVTPTSAEIEYGWIVRGNRVADTAAFEVARFQEKPAQAIADGLWRTGGLWNTFIQSGPVHLFWRLARRLLPIHAEMLERYAAAIGSLEEAPALAAAYTTMPSASFSRDVLAHANELAVVQVDGSGWSDWGSPSRVFASLSGTSCHDRLVDRIRGNAEVAA